MLDSHRKRRYKIRQNGVALFLVLLSVFLFYTTSSDRSFLMNIRQFLTDIIAPISYILSRPVVGIHYVVGYVSDYIDVVEENTQLKENHEELLIWKQKSIQLQARLLYYESLLELQPYESYTSLTAHVTADLGGSFVRSVLINVGKNVGIYSGYSVTGKFGLIGRVVSSGLVSSRVLLLNDINSRIPVFIPFVGQSAIMIGDNGIYPTLNFISGETVTIPNGMQVVTSGYDRNIPKGLLVGTVFRNQENELVVRLVEDLGYLDVVRVLKYMGMKQPTHDVELPEILHEGITNNEGCYASC